jgi:hypothetical protein
LFSEFLERHRAEIRRQEIERKKLMALDLKVLMQRKARLESEIARERSKQKEAARKADSKRKIVLGGVLIAAVRDGGIPEHLVRRLIEAHASVRDKAIFENFTFEVTGPETATTEFYGADQPSGE